MPVQPQAASARQQWEASFAAQIAEGAYNTAPVEPVVRMVAYYLRHHVVRERISSLKFLELGCGAGPTLVWLAQKGIEVSGVDISPTALQLARQQLERAGCAARIGTLTECSVISVPHEDGAFDGVIESCVFQHLPKAERAAAFREAGRLLRPGGLFVGYLLDVGHTIFAAKRAEQLPEDPGTLILSDQKSRVQLENLGLCHFYRREELPQLLRGFSAVDPCLTTYALPREEAKRRGYDEYVQSMWTVYAIK
ncbi:MAG: class I SAM-dependent methyltransferase [Candidatus Omnitrophica bacterium]|nr:class I SAM-dependent methyltransferase [Candidatus Omnitrophota bacterium]